MHHGKEWTRALRAPEPRTQLLGPGSSSTGTAIPGQEAPKQLLVLGFHNTGTSIVTRCLQLMGVWAGSEDELETGKRRETAGTTVN